MLDRSTRTFWGVGFLVSALLVVLWLIVRERPIEEWGLALLLVVIAVLLFLWGRWGASGEQPAAPSAKAETPHVREFEIAASQPATPALVTPVAAQVITSAPAAPPVADIPASAPPEPAHVTTVVEEPAAEAPVMATFTKVEEPAPIAPSKRDNLLIIEGIGPKMDAALRAEGVDTYRKVADASVADLRAAIEKHGLTFAPSLVNWSKQARFLADGDQTGFEAYRDHLVRGLEPGQVVSRDYVVSKAPAEAPTAAAASTTKPRGKKEADSPKPKKEAKPKTKSAPKPPKPVKPDDLKVVEGIGPKMEKALNAAGILTFAQLAAASDERIRAAIEAGGMRFAPSVPTWAKQADYAAKGDMDGLKAYQASLTAGRAT